MFKDLFNDEKKKKFRTYAYGSFGAFILFLLLTIILWSAVGPITLALTIFSFGIWFYTATWLVNSNRFKDIKEYLDRGYGDEIMRVVLHARMHQKDIEVFKELGMGRPFYFAYVNGTEGQYMFSYKEKGMVFAVTFKENEFVYSYEVHEVHDSDQRNNTARETVYYSLNRSDYEGLDFKQIIMKLMELYDSIKK